MPFGGFNSPSSEVNSIDPSNFFSNLYYKIMDKFTVKKPEIKEDDFNKDLYNQIFGDDYEE